jgi:hypothetical protein
MTTEERRAAAPYLYHSGVKWIQKETAEQTPAHNAANPTVPKMLTLGADLGRWGWEFNGSPTRNRGRGRGISIHILNNVLILQE